MDFCPLLSVRDVADRLEIATTSANKVVFSGLAGPVFAAGRGFYVGAAEVENLAERKWIAKHPRVLVVNVAPPPDEGDPQGWELNRSSQLNLEGIRGWWPVAQPGSLLDQHLVAVVGTFVVMVVKIVDWQRKRGRVQFDVCEADTSALKSLDQRRVPPAPGPIAYILEARP